MDVYFSETQRLPFDPGSCDGCKSVACLGTSLLGGYLFYCASTFRYIRRGLFITIGTGATLYGLNCLISLVPFKNPYPKPKDEKPEVQWKPI